MGRAPGSIGVADDATGTPSRAVVIGGSIAGLLAARVLTDHFAHVTLFERDRFPDAAEPRKGLPQGRHLHILLARGAQVLEELFPGISDALTAAGAERNDPGHDIAWLTPAGWGVRFASPIRSFACSRPLLDHVVRRHAARLERLTIVENTEVTGLRLSADGASVTGVTLASRDGGKGPPDGGALDCDLVVDASGRTSRTADWLAGLGFERPAETVMNAYLGYASRLYERPPGAAVDWKCLYVQAAPPERTRGGVIFGIEGGRWLVTVGGMGGDYPPTDEAGFVDFMRSLASPRLFEAASAARPLSPIVGFRATENRWRHFERVSRRPEGLVVTGDAACAFNPVYGQGMTMAALAALGLGTCLAEQRQRAPGSLDGLAARFQRRLAGINKAPWVLATSQDCRSPRFDGAPPNLRSRLMHAYLDRIIAHNTTDAILRRTFLDVLHMIEPPSALFRPSIVARALRRLPAEAR